MLPSIKMIGVSLTVGCSDSLVESERTPLYYWLNSIDSRFDLD